MQEADRNYLIALLVGESLISFIAGAVVAWLNIHISLQATGIFAFGFAAFLGWYAVRDNAVPGSVTLLMLVVIIAWASIPSARATGAFFVGFSANLARRAAYRASLKGVATAIIVVAVAIVSGIAFSVGTWLS